MKEEKEEREEREREMWKAGEKNEEKLLIAWFTFNYSS